MYTSLNIIELKVSEQETKNYCKIFGKPKKSQIDTLSCYYYCMLTKYNIIRKKSNILKKYNKYEKRILDLINSNSNDFDLILISEHIISAKLFLLIVNNIEKFKLEVI